MNTRLAINELTIRFPGQLQPAVNNVSLSVQAGRMLALVGESGSGKSLTALSVPQLLPTQANWHVKSIELDGEDISRASGFVFVPCAVIVSASFFRSRCRR